MTTPAFLPMFRFIDSSDDNLAHVEHVFGSLKVSFEHQVVPLPKYIIDPEAPFAEQTAICKAELAYLRSRSPLPIVVLQCGLRVYELGDMPGTGVQFCNDLFGPDALATLLDGKGTAVRNRRCSYEIAIAYLDGANDQEKSGYTTTSLTRATFVSALHGRIATSDELDKLGYDIGQIDDSDRIATSDDRAEPRRVVHGTNDIFIPEGMRGTMGMLQHEALLKLNYEFESVFMKLAAWLEKTFPVKLAASRAAAALAAEQLVLVDDYESGPEDSQFDDTQTFDRASLGFDLMSAPSDTILVPRKTVIGIPPVGE
jgi:hypothetical protein